MAELDQWLNWYNKEQTHSEKYCYGKTPWQTFLDTIHLAYEKQIDSTSWRVAEASSIDNPLLSSKMEGLAREDDSSGRLTTHQ